MIENDHSIKPILFAFFKSDAVEETLVDLLEKLAKETDNDLDDTAVACSQGCLESVTQCRVQFPAFVLALASAEDTLCRPVGNDQKYYHKKLNTFCAERTCL